jgi:peptidoglycan/xylan/chitin deacetylase (PgdA/CDA1 family)
MLSSVGRRTASLGARGPIVTFTFDDFPRSALTVGGDILERFGGRATYYVAMGLMGARNAVGEHFHLEDIRDAVERGHEVGSHTFSHPSARKTSVSEFMRDVDRGENAIREGMNLSPSRNFAYPYGEVTLAIKEKLGARMGSCRGTCDGLNGPDVDLNLLRSNRLYGDVDQADAAKRLIIENEKQKSWLIFYSHDVDSSPSPYGCTPALLEQVVSFAADHSARLATVEDVVNEICVTA